MIFHHNVYNAIIPAISSIIIYHMRGKQEFFKFLKQISILEDHIISENHDNYLYFQSKLKQK